MEIRWLLRASSPTDGLHFNGTSQVGEAWGHLRFLYLREFWWELRKAM